MSDKKDPLLETMRQVSLKDGNIIHTSDGTRVRIKPVAAPLISQVAASIKPPKPPVWKNPQTGVEEPNPMHPDYVSAMEAYEQQKAMAAVDAMIVFGIELVDGLPEDEGWLDNLRLLASMGALDLSGYDLDDPLVKELLYKRFVLATSEVLSLINNASGISDETIAEAVESFRGN